ncbi:MAG: hypothetical protein ACOCRX_01315 [Candidatus Woesearchaeota archaeon]
MKKLLVANVDIIGWGGGPGMTFGITYKGLFEVNEDISGMLKFTALEDGSRQAGKTKKISKGFVFYAAPNTIREMIEVK